MHVIKSVGQDDVFDIGSVVHELPRRPNWHFGKDVALDGSASEEQANVLLRVALASVGEHVNGRDVHRSKVVDSSNSLGRVKSGHLTRRGTDLRRVNLGSSRKRHRRDGRVPVSGWTHWPCGAERLVHKPKPHTVMRSKRGIVSRRGSPHRVRLLRCNVASNGVHVKVLDSRNLNVVVEEFLVITRASSQIGGNHGCCTKSVSHLPNRIRVRLEVDVKLGLGVEKGGLEANTRTSRAYSACRVLKCALHHEITNFGRFSGLNGSVKPSLKDVAMGVAATEDRIIYARPEVSSPMMSG